MHPPMLSEARIDNSIGRGRACCGLGQATYRPVVVKLGRGGRQWREKGGGAATDHMVKGDSEWLETTLVVE